MIDTTVVVILIFLALCSLGLSWFAGSDAPFVPSELNQISKVLKKAGVKKSKNFYELGSGDGRVVIEAANLGAKSYGVEQSWLRVLYSRAKARQLGLKEIWFYHGNLFDREYFSADVVYLFLLQGAVDKLEKKLKKELKKDGTVITQKYHFKSWKPKEKLGDFWLYKT